MALYMAGDLVIGMIAGHPILGLIIGMVFGMLRNNAGKS